MKTLIKIIITFIVLFTTLLVKSQNRYLRITLSDTEHDYVSFPPGTKFELKDEKEAIVYSNKSLDNTFKIETPHTLIVYPSWKSSTDTFEISNGKIEQIPTSEYGKKHIKTSSKNEQKSNYKKAHSNGITLEKTLIPSDVNPDRFNATFKFSNGITASYMDGEFTAQLNGKDLAIEYRYFIYSELGIIKLSFNSKTGKTWWIFEPS